jgi:HK97 family phage portal protein
MSIVKSFFSGLFGKSEFPELTEKSIDSLGGAYTASNVGMLSQGVEKGSKELIETYNTSPNLRKVVSLISNSLAAVPFYLTPKSSSRSLITKSYNTKNKITDHPFLDFLYRGSPLMPGMQGLKASYAYKEIKGEFFWHLYRDEKNIPTMWVPISPLHVTSLPTTKNPHYTIVVGGRSEKIKEEDIFWSKDVNLSNLFGRGSGVGQSLADEIDSDEYAAKLLRLVFANKGFKDTIISIKSEGGANDNIAEQLEAKYNQRSRSFYNAGRAMVIDGGQVDVKPLTYSMEELQLLNLRQWERDIIYQTFGIPPELFGLVENSNRATINSALTIFGMITLTPRLETLRSELELKLLPYFDPTGQYNLCFDSPVPVDKDFQLDVMKASPDSFSDNDYRLLAGFPPIPGGDLPKEEEDED